MGNVYPHCYHKITGKIMFGKAGFILDYGLRVDAACRGSEGMGTGGAGRVSQLHRVHK